MQSDKSSKHKIRLRPEIFIVIAMILLLTLISGHCDVSDASAISININGQISILTGKDDINKSNENNNPTFDFQYGTCYLIEVQNQNGSIIDQLSFENKITTHEYLLAEHNVIESINENKKSQVSTTIDGINMTIYSAWVTCGHNEYLVQYIINENKVNEFIIYKILSHVVVILCYIMLLRMIYFQIKGTSNRYEKSIQQLYADTN